MEKILKQIVLAELQALKPELVARYRVKGLELFGSVARDEQHEKSDIDLLVEFSENADMFDLVGLGCFLKKGSIGRWMLSRRMHSEQNFNPRYWLRPLSYERLSLVPARYFCGN